MDKEITHKTLKELAVYDPSSGDFIWKIRQECWFKSKRSFSTWNARYAGKIAGCVKHDNNGYACRYICLLGKRYSAHRLAWFYMTGEWPAEIDHVNRNSTDNRFTNLQDVDRRKNGRNKSLLSNSKSGFTGISWHSRDMKWQAYAKLNGSTKYIGMFDTIVDAVAARMRFNRDHDFSEGHGKPRPKYTGVL